MSQISRRDAIKKVALLVGGTLALPDILKAWSSPSIDNLAARFTPAQEELIAEIAETIVPTTDTPGAKAAGVHKFIQKIVADCFEEADRKAFFEGLKGVDLQARDRFAHDFVQCSPAERTQVLRIFESAYFNDKANNSFWMTLKNLCVTGYFTSEIGCTQALRYEAIPGRYDGAMPYKKGDKAWAT
ncbi:MAG: gluconate 2-dehydrogenase subunit 3 family protein [Lewinellaceae bacterium]|nr:gluconate 2-dehydrogenase subunit 3 family protein [Lewinellaceae bacterium]